MKILRRYNDYPLPKTKVVNLNINKIKDKFISDETIMHVDVFLKNGGGLIWFSSGMEADPAFDKYFSNLNFPIAHDKIESDFGAFNVRVPKIKDNAIHDLDVRKLSDELPEVFQYIKHTTKSRQKVHLELNNGDPLLIDFKRGKGKVFYFSSILDLDWNDMPLRGLLVPLMYKLLVLGGTDEVNSMPVKLGRVKWITLDGNEQEYLKGETVLIPQGVKHRIENKGVEKVVFIEALGDFTKLIIDGSPNGIILRTMKEWERILPKNPFIRIHRSHIVNINYIYI